jgi:diguanylate cyclase (GGDEF)-like protein
MRLASFQRLGLSFRAKLRLALVIAIVIAILPVPLAATMRLDAQRHLERAGASVHGLDQIMVVLTATANVRTRGFAYIEDPTPYRDKRLRSAVDTIVLQIEQIRARNASERRRLDDVARVAQVAYDELVATTASGDQARARRELIDAIERGAVQPLGEIETERADSAAERHNGAVTTINRGLQRVSLLLMGAALLLAIVAWHMPRRLAGRLERLRDATHELAAGRLEGRVLVGGRDEIASLARDFDALAMSLTLREAENRRLLAQQVDRATRDSLTGLRNNRFFHEALAQALRVQGQRQLPVSVAVLDLDNFKLVNDQFGHAEGDAVLLRLSRALEGESRQSDIACRLGGEEFAIIFRGAAADAVGVMDRVAKALRGGDPDGRKTTFSCGVVEQVGGAADALFKAADDAAYEAKARGKNQIVIGRSPAADAA